MPTKLYNRLFVNPLTVFFGDAKAIGITLVVTTALSLWLSNGAAFAAAYTSFWQRPFTAGFIIEINRFFPDMLGLYF